MTTIPVEKMSVEQLRAEVLVSRAKLHAVLTAWNVMSWNSQGIHDADKAEAYIKTNYFAYHHAKHPFLALLLDYQKTAEEWQKMADEVIIGADGCCLKVTPPPPLMPPWPE